MLQALIFDFDGLILDTETPLFSAWTETFENHGVEPIGLDEWSHSLGRHGDDPEMLDPLKRLQELLQRSLDRDEIKRANLLIRDRFLDDLPIRPGVTKLLDDASERNIPVAIASSSRPEWINRNLVARNLAERFPLVHCAGNGIPGKPHPAVYLSAAKDLAVDPAFCLALEDSPNGTTAAKAAGMRCVAVPNTVSAGLDLSHADRVLPSLMDVNLSDWH